MGFRQRPSWHADAVPGAVHPHHSPRALANRKPICRSEAKCATFPLALEKLRPSGAFEVGMKLIKGNAMKDEASANELDRRQFLGAASAGAIAGAGALPFVASQAYAAASAGQDICYMNAIELAGRIQRKELSSVGNRSHPRSVAAVL